LTSKIGKKLNSKRRCRKRVSGESHRKGKQAGGFHRNQSTILLWGDEGLRPSLLKALPEADEKIQGKEGKTLHGGFAARGVFGAEKYSMANRIARNKHEKRNLMPQRDPFDPSKSQHSQKVGAQGRRGRTALQAGLYPDQVSHQGKTSTKCPRLRGPMSGTTENLQQGG